MTEKIIVEFDVEDNGTPKVAKFNDELGNTKQAAENASSGTQKASLSLTDLYSATQLAERGLALLRDVFNETVGVTVNYANEVRQMRDVTGQTAEESSRLLQVLDDYKISADQAGQATKKLASKDMELNIQTLARLSDQYKALGSDVERTKFLYDNFGKSGSNFAEIMKQGGDAILKANDAIPKNLVLTDQQLQKAREYEKQVDNLSDAWLGFKVAAGNEALPYVTNALDSFNKKVEDTSLAWAAFSFGFDDIAKIFIDTNKDMELSVERVDKGERDNITTVEDLSDASDRAAQAAAEYAAKLEEVSKANQNLINSAIAITDETRKYQDAQADIQAQIADLQAEKDSYYAWDTEKIDAAQEKIDDLSAKYDENAEAFIAAMEKKFVMMAIEKIALEDGVAGYSDAEYQKAQAILQTTDVATAAAFSQAQAQAVLTDAVANGQISVEQFRDILQKAGEDGVISLEEVAAAMDAIPPNKTLTIDVITNGMIPTNLAPTATNAPVGTHKRSNAKGGTYMIPMSWGNENFPIGNSDTASGGELISITPKGQNQNKDIVDAIYATRINIDDLTRAFVLASQQVTK